MAALRHDTSTLVHVLTWFTIESAGSGVHSTRCSFTYTSHAGTLDVQKRSAHVQCKSRDAP
eukprot:3217215-Amphidinium_carterae.1